MLFLSSSLYIGIMKSPHTNHMSFSRVLNFKFSFVLQFHLNYCELTFPVEGSSLVHGIIHTRCLIHEDLCSVPVLLTGSSIALRVISELKVLKS